MARTHVQQSQISGSLSISDSLPAGLSLAGQGDLVGDLNALRSQIKRAIGEANWYSDVNQDLADIYTAVHMTGADAAFQGNITAGDATFTGALAAGASTLDSLSVTNNASVGGNLGVTGDSTLAGLTAGASTLASLNVTNGAAVGGTLAVTDAAHFMSDVLMDQKLVVSGAAGFDAGIVVTNGGLEVAGDKLEVTGSFAVKGDSALNGALDVSGKATVGSFESTGNASVDGTLGVTGAATMSSTLTVGGAATLGSSLSVAGASTLHALSAGASTLSSLNVTGNSVMQGSAQIIGAVNLNNSLTVAGLADFNGGVTANSIKIDGDTPQRLYIVDTDGSMKDEQLLTFNGSKLNVYAALDVSSASDLHGAVHAYSTLTVDSAASLGSTLSVTGAATMNSTLGVSGKATVGSFESSGVAVLDSTLSVSGDATFMSDVEVAGDLRVKGATTWIETDNLKVKDSLIHISTGSNSAASRGIVLHGGDVGSADLAVGAKAGGYDFIFAKAVDDIHVDDTNAEIFSGSILAGAWMNAVKLGDVEGTLSGSLAADPAGMLLSSAAEIKFDANGEAFTLAKSADQAAFEAEFGAGTSIIAAITAAAAGGNFKQGNFKPGTVGALAAIDFSAVGSLRAADLASDALKEKAMDVYLNGVRLAYSADYSISSDHEVSLAMDTMADDVIIVAIHNAA